MEPHVRDDQASSLPRLLRGDRRRHGCAALVASAALLGWAATIAGPIAAVFAWGAASYAFLGAAYLGGRQLVWKDAAGMRPLYAALASPYALMSLAVLFWMRAWGKTRAAEIVPGVWLGPWPIAADGPPGGFGAVLDLTAELPRPRRFRRAEYLCLPTLDGTSPATDDVRRATGFIAGARERGVPVLVHCAMGRSRSATCVAAWLVASGRVSGPGEAFDLIRARSPRARPSRSQASLLAGTAGDHAPVIGDAPKAGFGRLQSMGPFPVVEVVAAAAAGSLAARLALLVFR